MSGLFSGGTTISTTDQRVSSIQLPTSGYGMPVPIAFGQCKVSFNLLDYDDFQAIPHTTSSSSGGKGGGGAPGGFPAPPPVN